MQRSAFEAWLSGMRWLAWPALPLSIFTHEPLAGLAAALILWLDHRLRERREFDRRERIDAAIERVAASRIDQLRELYHRTVEDGAMPPNTETFERMAVRFFLEFVEPHLAPADLGTNLELARLRGATRLCEFLTWDRRQNPEAWFAGRPPPANFEPAQAMLH